MPRGPQRNFDLYYATRASRADAFGAPQPFLATADAEYEPCIREDGCELFFVQGPTTVDVDVYSMTVAP